MVFHSLEYAAFFTIVVLLYLLFDHKRQNRLLLIGSYIFYGSWDWRFLSLIALTTVTDYFCSRAIHREDDKSKRKRFVALSCAVNLSVLGFFKYFDFFVQSFSDLFSIFGADVSGPVLNIVLPVGISFYTFQSLSYTIDVYRKQVKPAENIFDYALYVAFFPQLVAGPIERGRNLLPQVISPRVFDSRRIYEGLFLIYLGLFKKLFIADNLARYVDPVFKLGANPDGGEVLIAGYAFLFQVYCDFSAYTDIARGSAKLLGFELMENFRAPYLARNLQEFWNRWHISLTTWIRDYLYYPLAFKRFRKKSLPVWLITVLTFSIMGLWHGAAWGFVLWGVYNGAALAIYAEVSKRISKRGSAVKKSKNGLIWKLLSIAFTFHVILIGDLFFRSDSLSQAGAMVVTLFTQFTAGGDFIRQLAAISFYILPMVLIDVVSKDKPLESRIFTTHVALRTAAIYAMLAGIVIYGVSTPTFVYFQF